MLMDRIKCIKKCLDLLQINQFIKLNHDPTNSVGGKIQRLSRKFKSRLSRKQYYELYPTASENFMEQVIA